MLLKFQSLIVFVFAFVNAAAAHDLWFEDVDSSKPAKGMQLFYGHKFSSHGGSKIIPYEPSVIKEITCLDKSGKISHLESSKTYPLILSHPGACAVATRVLLSTGFWSKTPYGTKNLPKTEVSNALRAWQSYEALTVYNLWHDSLKEALGQGLEILLSENPETMDVDDKFTVKIVLDGKPVEGALVSYDENVRGDSNSEGKVKIKMRKFGRQRIDATLTTPASVSNQDKIDEVVRSATLSFEVPEKNKSVKNR